MLRILKKLIQLRRQHEEAAEQAVLDARHAYDRAVRDQRLAENELADCQERRSLEEAALWSTVIGREVRVSAMDELRKQLQAWQEKEIYCQQQLAKAVEHLQASEKALEDARRDYAQAWRRRDTMEQYAIQLEDTEKEEADHREELEIEDFAVRKHPAF